MTRPHDDDWLREDTAGHDPSLADDVLADDPHGHDAHGQYDDYHGAAYDEHHHDEHHHGEYDEHDDAVYEHHGRRGGRRRSPAVTWVAVIGALALVLGAGYYAVQQVSGLVPSISFGGGGASEADDYPGPGTGEVQIEIPPGAGGGQIGQILAEADVVASAGAFQAVATADSRAQSIQPGTYRMAQQMSAAGALERLVDSSYRQVSMVTIPEGLWTEEIFARLAEATGHDVEEYEAVDPADLDLPEAAQGDLEGYLYPDTYQFSPSATPQQQLQDMVDLGKRRFAELGLDEDTMQRTIIVASIVQGEAAFADDLPKVARVIENRLADNEPLGMDSTIHFIAGERGMAGTTNAQRAEDSPYNTYLNAGLPPGPINSPGAASIEAAMNPAEGTWKFFVTVNPDTGETVFTDTFAEHQVYEAQFIEWCRENRDRC